MIQFSKKQLLDLSERYSYKTEDELVEKELKAWLGKNRYLDRKRFIRLCSWKSPRQKRNYSKNNDLLIREITKFSFSTKSEEARIKSLLILSGVQYPVASTILHFAFPNKYPIMDFRVIWSLGWKQPKSYNFDFWQNYCKEIITLSRKFRLSIRELDKALWMNSKKNQKSSI